jgi:hypothetical protein
MIAQFGAGTHCKAWLTLCYSHDDMSSGTLSPAVPMEGICFTQHASRSGGGLQRHSLVTGVHRTSDATP